MQQSVDYSFLGAGDLNGDYMVRVSNSSRKRVQYKIDDLNIRRDFLPSTASSSDVKVLTFHELYMLKNSPGGEKLIYDNLLIKDNKVRQALDLPTAPEYEYTYDDIFRLTTEGSKDEILDALEFGPYFIGSQMKGILVREDINLDYDKIKFFEGLFSMSFNNLLDNVKWAEQDSHAVSADFTRMRKAGGNAERRSVISETRAPGRRVKKD